MSDSDDVKGIVKKFNSQSNISDWLVRKSEGEGDERPQLFPSTGAKKVLVFTICPVLRLFHNLRLSRHGHEHMSQHSVGLKWPQNGPGRQSAGRKVLLLGGGHM